MTETMTAIAITSAGAPDVLKPESRERPQPRSGEILVRVAAAGVNRPDVFQRLGHYDPPPGAPDIPGLEIAGHVAAIGPDAGAWKVGDAVCALVAGGGYAEYCTAPAPQCLPVPDGLSLVEAAALPETFFTVWSNVFDRGRLVAGEAILIHGGSSGIGTTAIQLAREAGARIFTTAGSAEKCRVCTELGAERAINYREEDFVAVVAEATGGRGVDVVLDMVGGDYIPRSIKSLAPDGRHVSIAFLRGSKAEIDFNGVMRKRLTLTGSTLRPRPIADKAAIADKLLEHVWPKIASGAVKPLIHATFPLAEASKAHALMESSEHIGKIVLTVA